MIRALLAAAAVALLLARPAAAEEKDRFAKVPPVVLELYDEKGIFHLCVIELVLQMPEKGKVSEKVLAEKMQKVLNAIPYEDYVKSNPAPLIKSMALDMVRKEPGGTDVKEVLIKNIVFR